MGKINLEHCKNRIESLNIPEMEYQAGPVVEADRVSTTLSPSDASNGVFAEDQRPEMQALEQIQHQASTSDIFQLKSASALSQPKGSAAVNRTGLPDKLKSGLEHLSGFSMDDVKVHYNSSAPAQLQALAFARGNQIHLAPGQAHHLPHEAWHVVQQKSKRVKATGTQKGMAFNDNSMLEREADVMGQKASVIDTSPSIEVSNPVVGTSPVVQMVRPSKGPWNPETEPMYKASAGKFNRYKGGRPVKFGARFKSLLIERFVNQGQGYYDDKTKINYLRVASGGAALPEYAVQIDHITPWVTYEKELLDSGLAFLSATKKYIPYSGQIVDNATGQIFFTEYAAKMYYHDLDNLVFEAPSKNASKGANEVDEIIFYGIPSESMLEKMGQLHTISNRAEVLRNTWATLSHQGKLSDIQIKAIENQMDKVMAEFELIEAYTTSINH